MNLKLMPEESKQKDFESGPHEQQYQQLAAAI
jgi:hypothetical protein